MCDVDTILLQLHVFGNRHREIKKSVLHHIANE